MLQIITIICVTHVQKNFQIRASIKQLLTKYQIFTKLPQIPHIHINRNFSSIFVTFLGQLLHPYKFYGRDMSGILFFIFASCEPLSQVECYQCNRNQYFYKGLLGSFHNKHSKETSFWPKLVKAICLICTI